MIRTKCYNQVREWPSREAAIDFFEEGVISCDPGSSESARYAFILTQLYDGADYATDDLYLGDA